MCLFGMAINSLRFLGYTIYFSIGVYFFLLYKLNLTNTFVFLINQLYVNLFRVRISVEGCRRYRLWLACVLYNVTANEGITRRFFMDCYGTK